MYFFCITSYYLVEVVMEAKINEVIDYNHVVSINERKSIYLTGVIKMNNFDSEEFLIETNMGHLVIKGEGLELIKFDTKENVISIKGLIINLCYVDDLKKQKKQWNIKIFLSLWLLPKDKNMIKSKV